MSFPGFPSWKKKMADGLGKIRHFRIVVYIFTTMGLLFSGFLELVLRTVSAVQELTDEKLLQITK